MFRSTNALCVFESFVRVDKFGFETIIAIQHLCVISNHRDERSTLVARLYLLCSQLGGDLGHVLPLERCSLQVDLGWLLLSFATRDGRGTVR